MPLKKHGTNMKKIYNNFDVRIFLKKRPLSWSAISSFEYDPAQWHKRYVLNEKDEPSKEMVFGSLIGKKIEKDSSYIPEIIRHSKMEHPFKVVFDGIPLVGYADSFCDRTFRKLLEIKTGKKAWDQKRVDGHGQLDMYLLMNFITNKIRPEDVEISLCWLPTKENGDFSISFIEPVKPKIFKTKRTMKQILEFGAKINRIVKEMEEYAKRHENIPSQL